MSRRIGVVTVGRSDYGIYRPLLEELASRPGIEPVLYAGGMHFLPSQGMTIREVERDGWRIAARVEMALENDSPEAVAKTMGMGMLGFAQAYAAERPDLLVVLGDRSEMFAAAAASVPFLIPLAHLHGGEATFGAIDEAFRHGITKMAHLHFPATEAYARRIAQLGEDPASIHVSGALSADNIRRMPVLEREELESRFGLSLDPAPLLVTYHPETTRLETVEEDVEALLGALEESGLPVVLTSANADAAGRLVNERLARFTAAAPGRWLVPSFGSLAYFSMMRQAAAMVGNTSSGIIEAPGLGVPVVNIGDRQAGRVRGENVADCGRSREEIAAALRLALSADFQARARAGKNPYGDGMAAQRIADVLQSIRLDELRLAKRFCDLPFHSVD